MKDFSYITSASPSFIEGLYQDFVKNPESIDPEFRKFFEGFDFAVSQGKPTNGTATAKAPAGAGVVTNLDKEFGVYQLIQAYRKKAHLIAKTNPIRER
jgi:2-oxoglutarate dehydrogenase E1 component